MTRDCQRPAKTGLAAIVFCAGACMLASISPALVAQERLPADRPIHEVIDHYVDAKLELAGVRPADPADPHTLVRRLTLDLAGRIPTRDEVEQFLEPTADQRVERWIERMLGSPWYVRHTATELNTLLKGVTGAGPDLQDYLLDAVAKNRPWDRMFGELLGHANAPHQPERFVLGRLADLDLLTRDVSSLFFGLNISCAQCHTHPYVESLTQDYFFGLKSFFARSYDFEGRLLERRFGMRLNYTPPGKDAREVEAMFLSGETVSLPTPECKDLAQAIEDERKRIDELRVQFKTLQQKDKHARPAIPAQAEFNLRSQLVAIAMRADNRRLLAKSIVNRFWHRFLGCGLVMRIDQMHAGNPGSHPELLDWLASDMLAHDFDLQRLTCGILRSRAYSRSSRWNAAPPAPELFAVASVRPLTPMQMGISLLSLAPETAAVERPPEPLRQRISDLDGQARAIFGEVFEQPYDGIQFNASEALTMSNDPQRIQHISAQLVQHLLTRADIESQVQLAVTSILGRPARADEQAWISRYLEDRTDRQAAWQQVVWALCMSSEFRFNH